MKQPLVTVAMAVCNVDRFVAESVESVLRQTFTNFELVVVDFGSTDQTKDIVARYAANDKRIKSYEIPSTTLSQARNAASSHALGDYIAVMDADDVCLPDRLKLEVEFMERNPGVGLVGGATDWIDTAGRSLGVHSFPTDDQDIKSALETRFPFCHPTILIRHTVFKEVGGYRKPFVFAHDYDLGVRVSERFPCANLEQVVLKYRIHPQQVSLRKQQLQTLCRLAAQASARARKEGRADPLDSAEEITPATLASLGVQESRQRSIVAADCRNWIRSMTAAGEYSAALNAASDLLKSDRRDVESWQIADLHLTMAHIYWKQKRVWKAITSGAQAVAKRPLIVGRPLKGLLKRDTATIQ